MQDNNNIQLLHNYVYSEVKIPTAIYTVLFPQYTRLKRKHETRTLVVLQKPPPPCG